MKCAIVTPAPAGTTLGNRRTALRYATLLRELGHTARIVQRWTRGEDDILIALHAGKSHASVKAFARAHPGRPIVVVVTGTDVYGARAGGARVRSTLSLATRIVTLQPMTRLALDRAARAKSVAILQSVQPPVGKSRRARGRDSAFRVVALGHLRAVKDPFLLADAVEQLPADSRITVLHAGAALEAACERTARARRSPRWHWIGPRSHRQALALLRTADAFVQTSIVEGGSLALAEAVVAGVPVLVTRIPAAVGMLGARHPGTFPVGDAQALTRLLRRVETDRGFRARLRRASRQLAPRFAPSRERAAWRELLAQVTRRMTARRSSAGAVPMYP